MDLLLRRRYLRSCVSKILDGLLLSFVLILTFILPASASASEPSGIEAGKIIDARGEALVKPAGKDEWLPAEKGMFIYDGDTLATGEYGRIYALLSDESLLQLNSGSTFEILETAKTAGWLSFSGIIKAAQRLLRSDYRLLQGEMWLRNKNHHVFIDIDTPTAALGVRGTEMNIFTDGENLTVLTVLRGHVLAASGDTGEITAARGMQVVARAGRPLEKTTLVSPEDAVQWTVHIPHGLFAPGRFVTEGPARDFLEKAAGQAVSDRIGEALRTVDQGLAGFPESEDLQVYKAGLLIKTGDLLEAHQRLTDLTSIYPENPDGSSFSLSLRTALEQKGRGPGGGPKEHLHR